MPLIYLEEERSFGGSLDDGRKRMEYYHQVLDRAIAADRSATVRPSAVAASASMRQYVPAESRQPVVEDLCPFLSMLMAEAAEYRRFRAPQEDGQTLVDPPRPTLPDVVAAIGNIWPIWITTCKAARSPSWPPAHARSLVEQAVAYTRQYRDVSRPTS